VRFSARRRTQWSSTAGGSLRRPVCRAPERAASKYSDHLLPLFDGRRSKFGWWGPCVPVWANRRTAPLLHSFVARGPRIRSRTHVGMKRPPGRGSAKAWDGSTAPVRVTADSSEASKAFLSRHVCARTMGLDSFPQGCVVLQLPGDGKQNATTVPLGKPYCVRSSPRQAWFPSGCETATRVTDADAGSM